MANFSVIILLTSTSLFFFSGSFTELASTIETKKLSLLNKLGNLSCVLEQIKKITPQGEINMTLFGYEGVKAGIKL